MRLRTPATQRTPSPKTTPFASELSPCRKIESAVGSSSEEVSTSVSGEVDPLAASTAPPVPSELSQPCPATPVFAHGQAVASVPSPAQKAVTAPPPTSTTPCTELWKPLGLGSSGRSFQKP